MLKKLLIFIFAVILSIIFFEFFLRFSPFEYGLSPVEYDSKIGMWHKKNYTNYAIKECYKTKYIFDKDGLPKSIFHYNDDKEDVVILGDSYIEALMVENENIIHNALSKEFANKYNFLNYGLSGSSPTQQFIILKEKVNLNRLKYITQFIFLEGDLMDVDSKNLGLLNRPKVFIEFLSLDKYKILYPRAKNIYDKIGDFLGNFQLYPYIKKALYFIKDTLIAKKSVTNKDKEDSIDLSKNWLYLKGAIYQINNLSKKYHINYSLIIISENDKYTQIIKDFLNKNSIEYLILNKRINFELNGFECDSHWNDQTHINIAKFLREINFYK